MKIIKYGIGLCLLAGGIALTARVNAPRSADKFDRDQARGPFAVALFYEETKSMKQDRAYRADLKRLIKEFDTLSRRPEYKDSDATFIAANIADRDVITVASQYGISEQQLPTIVLFNKGRMVKDSAGKILQLRGFVSLADIDDFVFKYLGKDMQEYLKKKSEMLAEKRAEQAYWWNASAPYFYGYPYGYPGGYSGYGYGGWGYGPRVGVGFYL